MQAPTGARLNIITAIVAKLSPWHKEQQKFNELSKEVNLTIMRCEEMGGAIREVVDSNHFSSTLIYESQQHKPSKNKE